MIRPRMASAIIAVLLTALGASNSAAQAADAATVTHIVDGDTLDVQMSADVVVRIRLLNVDAPETGTCMAADAKALTAKLAAVGSAVQLSYDIDTIDPYGRTLADVQTSTVDSLSVALAASGLGFPVLVRPNGARYGAVLAATRQAESAQVGMFDPARPCTPVSHLLESQRLARAARSGSVATASAYAASQSKVGQAIAVASLIRGASYGVSGGYFRHYLLRVRAHALTYARHVRKALIARHRAYVAAHPPSPSATTSVGGSGGGYSGYNGPRCYEPGGKAWHPCP